MTFKCEKLSLTLEPSVCAQRHTSGNFLACKSCEIGAEHAGKPIEINLMSVCSRCQCTYRRIVKGRLCVSCNNRLHEFERGADARGKVPRFNFYPVEVICDNGRVFKRVVSSITEIIYDLAKSGISEISRIKNQLFFIQDDLFSNQSVSFKKEVKNKCIIKKSINYCEIMQYDLFA